MMKQTLKFEIELDENNLPLNIEMHASDRAVDENNVKALMVSAWAAKTKETLRIDLWTKDMPVNEMFIMYHQTMMGMADTLDRATGHDKLAGALRDYCEFFAEETEIKGAK
jgi:gliding motility-associated protein GldC